MLMEMFYILTIDICILGVILYYSFAGYHCRKSMQISLYCFLHVHLQLSPNKIFINALFSF